MDFAEERVLAEVTALEPLPDDPSERLEHLRLIAHAEGVNLDTCPECGQSLEGLDVAAHAEWHWPSRALNEALVGNAGEQTEAHKRKAALMRVHRARRAAAPKTKPEDGD